MANTERRLKAATKLANMILVLGGCVCLLLLLYVFYHYAWLRDREYARFGGVLYYGVPAGLAAGLFASLRLPVAQKINLALLSVSTAFSIYGAESVLEAYSLTRGRPREVRLAPLNYVTSYAERQRVAKSVKRHFGMEVDTRSAREVVEELRERGVAADLSPFSINELLRTQPDGSRRSAITLDDHELLPLAGVSQRVLVVCNENGPWQIMRSDAHGFANPPGLWSQPRLDIAALGDSYTYGYCVPPEANFVAQIRQRFPATLNLGMADLGPLVELAILREYLPPYAPRVVLWFYYEGNDLSDLLKEQRSPLLMRYLEEGFTQGLLGRQRDIDQALQDPLLVDSLMQQRATEWDRIQQQHAPVSFALRRGLKLELLRQRLGLVYGDEPPLTVETDLLSRVLARAQTQVAAWGGRLYFVYLPSWARYGVGDAGGTDAQHLQVLACVRRLGIPLIDLEPFFASRSDVLSLFPFREPGHYTEAGHRLVAEEVLKVIPSSGLHDHNS